MKGPLLCVAMALLLVACATNEPQLQARVRELESKNQQLRSDLAYMTKAARQFRDMAGVGGGSEGRSAGLPMPGSREWEQRKEAEELQDRVWSLERKEKERAMFGH